MGLLGSDVERIDAEDKVRGKAIYPGDINLPDQSYLKILFANRPHAIIREIDTKPAEQIEGVIAVFTAKDVPNNEHGLIPDRPVLCGPGSNKPFADHVRYIGDQVALVVAESQEIAENAIQKIWVDYEDLPVVSDPLEAIKPGSLKIHPERENNIFCHYQIRKGNIEQGFADSDLIIEEDYYTPPQEHAFLQPEAGIAYMDEENRVTIAVAGQWAHEEQAFVAHALGLPLEKVRIIHPVIGGAFGGREDISIQSALGLAVWRLQQRGINRPIKITWSREESMIGHGKRHPFFIHSRWGATKEGKIIAAEVKLIADGGAYAYTSTKVLGNATLMCTGPYEIPNVNVDSYAVYTNNIPTAAFRGFGGPQGAFSAESQINKISEKLKIDPVEIRLRNVLREGSLLSVNTPIPEGVTIEKVIIDCAQASGWVKTEKGWIAPAKNLVDNKPPKKRGIGFACALKNIGFSFGAPEQCTATIELHGHREIDFANVHHAGADVGQGAHTVFVQMAAEALVPIEKIRLVKADTAYTSDSGSSSASRMTFMSGNSIIGAAKLALEKWQAEERPAIATFMYKPPATTMFDPLTGECMPNFTYGYVAESIELEVDCETGEIEILNVVCSDDVGKAINPKLLEGQIEGALIQAMGYTLMENFIEKEGKVLTRGLSTYLIPTVLDIPRKRQTRILEFVNPIGPWGVRGMAEMPFLPFAPATTAALHDATGIWLNEFPLLPQKVFEALEKWRKNLTKI